MLAILIALSMVPAASAQRQSSPAVPAPLKYTIAVFRFANQTYQPELNYLENGVRDVIAQTLALHPQVEVVDPLRVDRAIRRHGANPRRPIPYGQAATIAKEVGADRAISGSFFQRGSGIRLWTEMVFIENLSYQWPIEKVLEDASQVADAALDSARQLLAFLPVDPEEVRPSFVVGSKARIEVSSTSPSVALELAGPADGTSLALLGYRIVSGKTIGQVEWDPAARRLIVQTAEGTANPNWTISLSAVVDCPEPNLRLALTATPGTRVELKVYNENLLGEPRLAKAFKLETDTPRADVLVSADALRRDGPLFVLARQFGPEEGSLPLMSPAIAGPAEPPQAGQ